MRQIVVTGGGTGIGRAVAEVFAAQGDQVVITGRRRDVLEDTAARLGAGVRAVAFDASDPEQVQAALDALPPPGDVPVNNAGGNPALGPRNPAPRPPHPEPFHSPGPWPIGRNVGPRRMVSNRWANPSSLK